ncbi:uncharacterized protein LOC143378780 [Andrena cerasifolii]|uniref:uncharacterized protein LOC143378780 n=1 Tax=Andrena cerasifolii TaxID=2819439 RepID=UPI004037FCA1
MTRKRILLPLQMKRSVETLFPIDGPSVTVLHSCEPETEEALTLATPMQPFIYSTPRCLDIGV